MNVLGNRVSILLEDFLCVEWHTNLYIEEKLNILRRDTQMGVHPHFVKDTLSPMRS